MDELFSAPLLSIAPLCARRLQTCIGLEQDLAAWSLSRLIKIYRPTGTHHFPSDRISQDIRSSRRAVPRFLDVAKDPREILISLRV